MEQKKYRYSLRVQVAVAGTGLKAYCNDDNLAVAGADRVIGEMTQHEHEGVQVTGTGGQVSASG